MSKPEVMVARYEKETLTRTRLEKGSHHHLGDSGLCKSGIA